jgi:predicted metal-dependent HD superfamily phosphohydrolase
MRTTFLTAQPHAHVRFRRAIERRALWLAEDAARELPNLPLEELLQLVHLYAEHGSPRFEPAARRWLARYLTEGTPSLKDVAKVTASLAKRQHD